MRRNVLCSAALLTILSAAAVLAQSTSEQSDKKIHQILASISADSIRANLTRLVSFGTRNTFSDTLSEKRGIPPERDGEFIALSPASAKIPAGDCKRALIISMSLCKVGLPRKRNSRRYAPPMSLPCCQEKETTSGTSSAGISIR